MNRFKTRTARRRHQRKGSILVLSALLMVVLFGMLAFSIDLGHAYAERAEMQRTADAAAIAAAVNLQEQKIYEPDEPQSDEEAIAAAIQFAAYNPISGQAPYLPAEDIQVGVFANPDDPSSAIVPGMGQSTTARVKITKSAQLNGETQFFFAQLLGRSSVAQNVASTATATYESRFKGFAATSGNVNLLPFALDIETYQQLQNQATTDEWTWDPDTKTISPGPDGVYEVNLYPQATGSPGNRGTVDIGHSGNSTADIKRQILDGISPSDLAYHGGKLEFDTNGELILNADTGISAAVKTQLTAIKGEPRIIPIFTNVSGNGNNANYTITQFTGIRIMDVKLTGKMSNKRVIVQPAVVRIQGGIPAVTGSAPQSQNIYSTVGLIQ